MLVRFRRREIGKVTGDLSTSTGLAATEKARRRVVKRVAGNMIPDGVGVARVQGIR